MQDRLKVERCNLVSICKLVVKSLIDSHLAKGYEVNSENEDVHLENVFVVLENILFHCSKGKKSILKESKDIWKLIEDLGGHSKKILEIITSIKEMSNIRTGLGRLRAWLRLAMMQKSLAEYFSLMIDHRIELSEYYEPGSLMLAEEASVICGLLVGINFLDCIIVFKDEDLDKPLGVINYSSYLKEVVPSDSLESVAGRNDEKTSMTVLIDQKLYLEEINRNQSSIIGNLNHKIETLSAENILLQEEMNTSKLSLIQLQKENMLMKNENVNLYEVHKRRILNAQLDIETERDTYQQSRIGLNALCEETERVLNDQVQMKLDVEKELEIQISSKQELEIGMRLLERDIQEKQDFIMSLRKQLEDIKSLNIELNQKAQDHDNTLHHKTDVLNKLEIKNSQMTLTIKDMENELKSLQISKKEINDHLQNLELLLDNKEAERGVLETDLKMEREWRTSLQVIIDQEKSNLLKLSMELQNMNDIKKEYENLLIRYNELQKLCDEQEKALAELGSHLSESKLKVENMMEAQLSLQDAQWTDDKNVAECKLCQKPFSVSRRKHHCRSCGEIFCQECSSTKMPLPSCPKPVRVCDACSTKLLKRFCL